MKKNVLRVISLILVAGMLFAFTACTQEIHIRFVDKDGNDIDIGALTGGTVQTGGNTAPTTPPPADNTPADNTPAPPATEPSQVPNPGTDAATQPDEKAPTEAASKPADKAPTEAAKPSNGMPATKEQILDFYKAAVNKVKVDRIAGYNKKEWQVIDAINIGPDKINEAIVKLAANFATTEDEAKVQECPKGSDEAEHRFPNFVLTDYSKVASATCTPKGSNYLIKIVMTDEDTPKKEGSMLGQVTNSILYWESIEKTLQEDKTVKAVLRDYSDIHVNYKHFTIEAEITPDGKFVSMDHTADVDIIIGSAKVLFFTVKDKSGHLINYCHYRDFQY